MRYLPSSKKVYSKEQQTDLSLADMQKYESTSLISFFLEKTSYSLYAIMGSVVMFVVMMVFETIFSIAGSNTSAKDRESYHNLIYTLSFFLVLMPLLACGVSNLYRYKKRKSTVGINNMYSINHNVENNILIEIEDEGIDESLETSL